MWLASLASVFVFVSFIIIFVYFRFRSQYLPHFNGPKGVIFFGNLFDFLRNWKRRNQWIIELTEQYGDVFQLCLPASPPTIVVTHPKLLEHVLKTKFDNYIKGDFFKDIMYDMLGEGIFNVDGEKWRVQRKTASKIFTMKALKETMTDVMMDHALVLFDHLSGLSASSPIDIQDCFQRFTLDSICRIAFGVDPHCLDFLPTNRTTSGHSFAKAFDATQRLFNLRWLDPSWKLKKFFKFGFEVDIVESLRVVNSFALTVIRERSKLSNEELCQQTDLLSQFMAMGHDVGGTPFSEQYLRDLVLNFIIAGRDTTAQCLTWAMYYLATQKDVQEKVKEEVDRVMGDVVKSPRVTYEVAHSLPYLHAVVHETLRLRPSVPIESKVTVADDVWPNGMHIPAGTLITPLLQASMRRKDVWGNDAHLFRPERWGFEHAGGGEVAGDDTALHHANADDAGSSSSSSSSGNSTTRKYNEFEFCAFQAGPRTCLGKPMALLEAKLMLAAFFQRFTIDLVPGQVVEEETSLTLPSRYPLYVFVTPRYK